MIIAKGAKVCCKIFLIIVFFLMSYIISDETMYRYLQIVYYI